jgi:hypothetical protein
MAVMAALGGAWGLDAGVIGGGLAADCGWAAQPEVIVMAKHTITKRRGKKLRLMEVTMSLRKRPFKGDQL